MLCRPACFVAAISLASSGFAPIGAAQNPIKPAVPFAVKPALAAITAANLKGDLSFLASDALEGRFSPSPGLNIAAEFIASQFRAAGLEPGVNGEYFQVAHMVDRRMKMPASDLTLVTGDKQFAVPASDVRIINAAAEMNMERCPALVFREKNADLLKGLALEGKAVIAPNFAPDRNLPEDEMMRRYEQSQAFDQAVAKAKARVEILAGRVHARSGGRLLDETQASEATPVVLVNSDALKAWLDAPTGATDRFVSFNVPAPEDKPVVLKNVIGVLPGSDPRLKNTYVLVTAHYDHIGTAETGGAMAAHKGGESSDKIYNGANDDGSGTVSVIEIARGLARLQHRPKRTLVFMTFFGEERGDIGSHYYAAHPVFPLSKTVADINLEQVGRTDATDGKQIGTASLTGFDYSDVTRYLQNAGRLTGVKVYLNKEASDAYFERSDNAALADVGVPAHTLCVAFDYPDYHGLGDEWPKVDYTNMAKVDRMVALGLFNLANAVQPPRWAAANSKTATFRAAQAKTQQALTASPQP